MGLAGRERGPFLDSGDGAHLRPRARSQSYRLPGKRIFLLIYASVHLGHLRLTRETGASKPLVVMAFLINAGMFLAFTILTVAQSWFLSLTLLVIVGASCVMELIVRRTNGPVRSTTDAA